MGRGRPPPWDEHVWHAGGSPQASSATRPLGSVWKLSSHADSLSSLQASNLMNNPQVQQL